MRGEIIRGLEYMHPLACAFKYYGETNQTGVMVWVSSISDSEYSSDATLIAISARA